MTKVKYSALVAEMRGKLNGSVMSKNRAGNYIRNKVTPVNPQTSYQMEQRSALSALSATWRSLSQGSRDAWANSAKDRPRTDIFGDAKVLSGQQLYVSANLNLIAAGSAQINVPGSLVDVPLVQIVSISFESDGVDLNLATIDINPETVPSGFKLIVYATPGVSPGISFVKNRYRYLGTFVPTSGTINFTSAYFNRFGAPTPDDKVFVRVALVSNTTGQLGLPFVADTLVVGV